MQSLVNGSVPIPYHGGSKFPAHGLLNQGAVVEAKMMCRGHSKWPRVVRSNASQPPRGEGPMTAVHSCHAYDAYVLCMFMSDFNTMSPCLFFGGAHKRGGHALPIVYMSLQVALANLTVKLSAKTGHPKTVKHRVQHTVV